MTSRFPQGSTGSTDSTGATGWSRRRLLGVIAGAGVVAGAVATTAGCDTQPKPPKSVPLENATQVNDNRPTMRLMNLCAHPDDDLYFMNPDVRHAIDGGASVSSVYLAAGEADGRNVDTRDPNRTHAKVDFSGYAEARQNGLRAAYAEMATGDRHSPWQREVVKITPTVMIERDTLIAVPRVKVHFFGTRIVPGARLRNLWEDMAPAEPTLVATDSPLDVVQSLTKEDIVQALTKLLDSIRPTVVHTMDPDPEHAAAVGGSVVSTDHQDHTATAAFVLEALERHRAAGGRPVVEHFRAYDNKLWPGNLSAAEYNAKLALLNIYGGAVPDCAGGMCGDKQVNNGAATRHYGVSTWLRYQPRPDWFQRAADGRLTAFVVTNGMLQVHTQRDPGGADWRVLTVPRTGLMPSPAPVQDSQGCWHVLALQRSQSDHGHMDIQVVHLAQSTPGGVFDVFEPVGNPQYNTRHQALFREIGVPVAAFDGSGTLHVFVRNFDHSVSESRRGPAGGWSGWQNIGGAQVQDTLTARTADDGSVELYAPTAKDVLRFTQATPGAALGSPAPLKGGASASPVTAVERTQGDRWVYYREPSTASIVSLHLSAGPKAAPTRQVLPSQGGTGTPTVLVKGAVVLLAHRNERGTVSWRDAADPKSLWQDLGGLMLQVPGAALDSRGRVCLAAIGVDGKLHLADESDGGITQGFKPWRAL